MQLNEVKLDVTHVYFNAENEKCDNHTIVDWEKTKPEFPNEILQAIIDNLWADRLAMMSYIKDFEREGLPSDAIRKLESKVSYAREELSEAMRTCDKLSSGLDNTDSNLRNLESDIEDLQNEWC